MDYLNISKTEKGIRIDGFPEAVKAVRIDSKKSRRFSDMVLHLNDLEFSEECLIALNNSNIERIFQLALWETAILRYMKCFGGNKGRPSQLNYIKVLKGDKDGQEIFNYFHNLRNKHFVHDENSYTQSIPGAIVNDKNSKNKIAKIVSFAAVGQTLNQINYGNLRKLVEITNQGLTPVSLKAILSEYEVKWIIGLQ